jgi:hypothetical protein
MLPRLKPIMAEIYREAVWFSCYVVNWDFAKS